MIPNPVTDVVNLTVDEDQIGTKVKVVTLDGRVVRQEVVTRLSFSMNVSGLQSGIYLIQTENGQTAKMIKR